MGFPSGHMAVGQSSHVRALSFVYGGQDASAGTPGESGVLEGEADVLFLACLLAYVQDVELIK